MKDLHKNPKFYYVLVPLVVGLWPLLLWAMYLPEARDSLKNEHQLAVKGRAYALDILALDPERVDAVDANEAPTEFSYATAIDKVAGICDIPASKYKLNTGTTVTRDKQKSQTAHVRIDEIGVLQLARFLSLTQHRWGTLQCEDISLSKVKGDTRPDVWTVELDFNYFF
jgi:hypothetical protein